MAGGVLSFQINLTVMKKKLFLVSIPITIAVLGLILVQWIWIESAFSDEHRKARAVCDAALRLSMEKFHSGERDNITKTMLPLLPHLSDSISIQYTGMYQDSMNIAYQNRILKQPDKKTQFLMRASFNIDHISVNLPSIIIDKNKKLKFDIGEKLEIETRRVVKSLHTLGNGIYTRADSTRIMNFVQFELKGMGRSDLANIVRLEFRSGSDAYLVDTASERGTSVRQYRPSGLNNYFGQRRWVAITYPGLQGLIAAKLLFFIMMSCLFTFLLIFSIVYLMKTILKQKQLADMKDDFINNLTHEFKTPIATVSAAVEGMQKFNALHDPEKTNRYLEVSRTELNRLNDMVTKVLNISSYEKKNLELELETVDLEATVNDVVKAETFRAVKPIQFSVNIAPGVKLITADALHLKNVLCNLVDNSVKYSKETVDISISAYADQQMVHIKIQDNGIGIPASAIKFVFDKFYRVTNGNLYNVKGNGLGLSYVKFVVEAHSGTISLKSEINVGTEFLIAIPLK